MRQKGILIMGAILLFILCLLHLSAGETTASPELIAQMLRTPHRDYIIAIKGDLSDNNSLITSLDPREVRAGRGDPVTWINESRAEVKMKFGKAPPCKSVTLKALGWRMEPDKCYETEDTLKPGFSTTIRFNEIGTFNYEIEYVDKNRNEKGVIRVQSENR
jgi:plastocyanin